MWTSHYERNSLISRLHFLLETWNHIDKCSQNSGGMLWIYSGTQWHNWRFEPGGKAWLKGAHWLT